MKKTILSLICLVLSAVSGWAQGTTSSVIANLDYEVVQQTAAFMGADQWAQIIVQTRADRELSFGSNVVSPIPTLPTDTKEAALKKNVRAFVYKTEEANGERIYYIKARSNLKTPLTQLYVQTATSHSLIIPVRLTSKGSYAFRVYDPQDVSDGTAFQEHSLKGNEYFNNGNYKAARTEYRIAAATLEATPEEKLTCNQYAEMCDNILGWIEKGRAAEQKANYDVALKYFNTAYYQNPNDLYLFNKVAEMRQKSNTICTRYWTEAENAYAANDYETAATLYENVIQNDCYEYVSRATTRLKNCKTQSRRRKEYANYGGVDYVTKSHMVGLSYGNYADRKLGGYLALRVNGDLFDLAQREYEQKSHASAEFSFGMTRRLRFIPQKGIFRGVWIQWGAGAQLRHTICSRDGFQWIDTQQMTDEEIDALPRYSTVESKYGNFEVENTKDTDYIKQGFSIAVMPQIGFLIKVDHFGLRFGLQYAVPVATAGGVPNEYKEYKEKNNVESYKYHGLRFAKDVYKDLGRLQWHIGIGYCF